MNDVPQIDPALDALIARMPKVELHVHLEGTLEPEMMMSLAQKNGVKTQFASAEEATAAYRFTDLQSFLDVYYAGCAVLITREDFRDLTLAYLARAHADNVRHVEPFFDPQTHTARGIEFDTVIGGILDGLAQGESEYGITSRLILSFLRDESAESAFATLAQARPWVEQLVAVGLDSAEVGNPPEKFAAVYASARAQGLFAVAHAGEEGGADMVARTLDSLHVERIDHGERAEEDPAVVRRLAEENITLTVCPLSNYRLKVVRSLADSTLKRLFDAGVAVTINSDDPAYFGGYISDNYRAATGALRLSRDDLVAMTRNAVLGSFASPERKTELLAELEAVTSSPT